MRSIRTAIGATKIDPDLLPVQRSYNMRLAPSHQRLSGEAGIGAQDDLYLRPACPDLTDNAGRLFHRAGTGIDFRMPKPGGKEMPTAEDVERRIAVRVVIALEEPAFQMAVQRIIGRIEIEHDLARRLGMRVE